MPQVLGWSFKIRPRLLLIGIVVLVVVQCLVWLVAGSIVWSLRGLMVGAESPEAADNARFAIAIFAAAATNGIALLSFLLRQRGWGWLLLIVIQSADVLATLAGTLLISAWWGLITVVAALTIAVLYLFQRSNAAPVVAKGEQAY